MIPPTGEVRDRRAVGRPDSRRRRLRQSGRRGRRRQCNEYKEIPVLVHANLPFMVFREITKALARLRGLG
jgi:hypothetical protein